MKASELRAILDELIADGCDPEIRTYDTGWSGVWNRVEPSAWVLVRSSGSAVLCIGTDQAQ